MEFTLDGSRLTIWLDGAPAEGLIEVIRNLISESAWEQVRTVVIDLGKVDDLHSHHLGEFALLKSDSLLREKELEFCNLHRELFGLFDAAGLDQIAKIELTDEVEDAERVFIGKDTICSLSMKDAGEQCAYLKQMVTRCEKIEAELGNIRQQLVHSEKVGTLGQLAAGVAHEFNNMLSIMSGYAQLAITARDIPEPVRDALEIIEESCVRAASVTEALLNFSRRKTPLKRNVDLNILIKQQLRLLASEFLAYNIETDLHLCDQAESMADPSQIDQVLLNLFTNAIHAMPEGGVLAVSSAIRKNSIVIVVADTGIGIEEKAISKIFAPFFTTKGAFGGGSEKGTGLGLSVSQGIVTNHGGTISVESTVGQGTVFTIILPIRLTEKIVLEPAAPIPDVVVKSKVLTILIVDDEDHMRKLMEKHLSAMGHIILLAANGQEAIQLCRESCPDLIFLDMLMPGMNGADALLEIRKIHSDVRVAVITGQAGKALEAMLAMMKRAGNIELIRKPFKLAEIKAFVQSHIDSN